MMRIPVPKIYDYHVYLINMPETVQPEDQNSIILAIIPKRTNPMNSKRILDQVASAGHPIPRSLDKGIKTCY